MINQVYHPQIVSYTFIFSLLSVVIQSKDSLSLLWVLVCRSYDTIRHTINSLLVSTQKQKTSLSEPGEMQYAQLLQLPHLCACSNIFSL